ncbi:MAG: hypothetical protein FWE98_08525 [Oscillospiraceae bacterium]|nr:hypothetical protein [Oscillospiraceae bacterium]
MKTKAEFDEELTGLTTREKIAKIRDAIFTLAVGLISSYQIGRRTVSYHSLKELRAYEGDLLLQLQEEERDRQLMPGVTVAFFVDGRR